MILPQMISLQDWAASLSIDLETPTPILMNGQPWQEWAISLLEMPQFEGKNVRTPLENEQWQDWAIEVYKAME